MDPLEERVRRGLRDDRWRVPPIDTDDALHRVHAGAARRRRQRTVVTAVASIAAIAGAAGGIGVLADAQQDPARQQTVASDTNDARNEPGKSEPKPNERPNDNGEAGNGQPDPNDDPQGGGSGDGQSGENPRTTAVPSSFHAVSMTAVSPDDYWVLGGVGQANASVAATADGGDSFDQIGTIDASVPADTDQIGPDTVTQVRFVDTSFGWAYGGGLWSTGDGGKTWTRSNALPGSVEQLEVDDGQAYALVDDGGGWSLWRTPATSDAWEQLPVQLTDPSGLAVTGSLVAVTDRMKDVTVAWVSENAGAAFENRPTPCQADLDAGELSASEGSLWLKCATGTAADVHLSTDAGRQWTLVNTGEESLSNVGSEIGARSAGEAVAATVGEVRTMAPSGAGSSSVPDLGQPVYTGFTTTSVGYVVDLDGQLFRTTDGGDTWNEVTVD